MILKLTPQALRNIADAIEEKLPGADEISIDPRYDGSVHVRAWRKSNNGFIKGIFSESGRLDMWVAARSLVEA